MGIADYFVLGILILAGLGLLYGTMAFIYDRYVSDSALRRNYPVLIRGRYLMEELGVFLRQYLFEADRTEMPFNRAQRSWVYRAAKGDIDTVPFGSTHDINTGTVFLPSLYPDLNRDSVPTQPYVIGEHTAHPYTPQRFFHISGMSYGSQSKQAVTALAKGSSLAGCWMNTGEGGITPYHLENAEEIVVQIGTAKYGLREPDGSLSIDRLKEVGAYPNVKMFEIKVGQGAKPGKGGILPGKKVNEEIAKLRGIGVGQDSMSPNRHPEFDKPEHILDMVAQVREITGKPCGFKLVGGNPLELEELISMIDPKLGPDFITLDGGEGGTGASPASLIDYCGLPLFDALPVLVKLLRDYNLYDEIEIIASGKLITPDQVALALAHGAKFVTSARGFMFALGCIQALKCNQNVCPAGVATDDPKLTKGLKPEAKAYAVARYVERMEYEVGVIAHSCGAESPRKLTLDHVR